MERIISFTLNGRSVRVTTDDRRMLLWVLRYDLGLTGTKYGCGAGLCGACTVIIGREAVRSCSTPVAEAAGKRILTIEGLERNGRLHPLQRAFMENLAFQCGYCTPGMILNACALLLRKPRPSRAEILEHMEGNLCRCGSHVRIIKAIETASSAMRGGAR